MPKKIIYLDHSATTPVDQKVLKAMLPYFSESFGNASSLHSAGSIALAAVDSSRAKIAGFLDCLPEEVYFSSGATESDNWAVLGLLEAILTNSGLMAKIGQKPHVIVSAIEHEAVLEPVKKLVGYGVMEATYLPVDKAGLVSVKKLTEAIKPNTVLVSVMLANNEIGTIQPIAELGKVIAKANDGRKHKIYFHTDATQAPAYTDCDVRKLGVDMMSLSAHKIYGPKGVGALYVKKGTPIKPLMYGGGQQKKMRSGTYNVSGIVGFGAAIDLLSDKKNRALEIARLKNFRDYLIKALIKKISKISVNGDLKSRLPSNVNFTIPGVEGESVVLMLSQQGICVSTGSACSTGSLEPSHVLLAIGVPQEMAHGSLRVTLGRSTKKSDIDALIKALPPIVEKLRAMSPLKY